MLPLFQSVSSLVCASFCLFVFYCTNHSRILHWTSRLFSTVCNCVPSNISKFLDPRSYLSDAAQTVATAATHCGLWLFACTDYVLLRKHSNFGEQGFAYTSPTALPETAFQSTFVASPLLQPLKLDIWKLFYLMRLLTLSRTMNNCTV